MFVKENAAEEGFNRWTINGIAYPMTGEVAPASFHLKQGKRYRLRMRNASDDIHPIHLHRHSFELTKISGKSVAGILKDVVMLGGYQEAEIDFVADNPGLTLVHCHQQLHMDFGFLTMCEAPRKPERLTTISTNRLWSVTMVGSDVYATSSKSLSA
jgi:FtsP/CotA-like multicopper oxidase with cupredoxin domain